MKFVIALEKWDEFEERSERQNSNYMNEESLRLYVLGITVVEVSYSLGTRGWRPRAWSILAALNLNSCSSNPHSAFSADLPRNSTYLYILECNLKTTAFFQLSYLKNVEELRPRDKKYTRSLSWLMDRLGLESKSFNSQTNALSLNPHCLLMFKLTN